MPHRGVAWQHHPAPAARRSAPFSYFRHIVISEQDYRDNPNEILAHEQAGFDDAEE